MSFTRFHDDPCRIQKYLEETTNIGNYNINVLCNDGDKPKFIDDSHIRLQKWGANLSNNFSLIESDLKGLTRKLNTDSIKQNLYTNYNENNIYNKNTYDIIENEITHQPRSTNPAWQFREFNYLNSYETPNNFNYLHLNPQEHVFMNFNNNISSRIVEKDYYLIKNTII